MATDSSNRLSFSRADATDTIIAPGTAAGRGALAILRLSGADSRAIVGAMCPGVDVDKSWQAQLVAVCGTEGHEIETAIVVSYRAPRSFTGEDMVELTVHGSTWIVEEITAAAVRLGARRAAPGEFSRRAVANGKMDLLQAEGINDLIRAETAWQAKLAREQMHGSLSEKIAPLRARLVGLRARIEASLDFIEQGVILGDEEMDGEINACTDEIRALRETLVFGERIREGFRLVITGPPNSGKSTLFNTLLRRERAIVTPHPGTTRDVLEARLDIGGVPVVLVDTAGIRSPVDPVEAEGIRRAETAAAGADLVVVLHPADRALEGGRDAPTIAPDRVLHVVSKSDLPSAVVPVDGRIGASCVTPGGLQELLSAVEGHVLAPAHALTGGWAINRRHEEALARAEEHLQRAVHGPREVAAAELRDACSALEEVLGGIGVETVLDAVFGRFCLGK